MGRAYSILVPVNADGTGSRYQAPGTDTFEDRFIRAEYLDALVIDTEVGRLMDRLEQAGPVRSDKWLDRTAPPRP